MFTQDMCCRATTQIFSRLGQISASHCLPFTGLTLGHERHRRILLADLERGPLPICMKSQQNRLCLCGNQMQTDSSWCGRGTSIAAAGRALPETLDGGAAAPGAEAVLETLRGSGLLQLFAWSEEGVTSHTFNARRDESRSRRSRLIHGSPTALSVLQPPCEEI